MRIRQDSLVTTEKSARVGKGLRSSSSRVIFSSLFLPKGTGTSRIYSPERFPVVPVPDRVMEPLFSWIFRHLALIV